MQKIRNLFNKKNQRKSQDSTASETIEPTIEEEAPNTSETSKLISVHVICPSARIIHLYIDVKKTLAELKDDVILSMADDTASLPLYATDMRQLAPRFRMFRAEYEGVELHETSTIEELNINDSDTLIIAPRRHYIQNLATQYSDFHSPTEMEIQTATKDLITNNDKKPLIEINEIFQQSNLQFDVRKVLISLAQSSAAVIGAGPYARRLIEMLKQKLVNKRSISNNTLTCLIDMGFKKEKAEYALKMTNGSYSLALEWLLQRQNDDLSLEETIMSMQKSDSVSSPSTIFSNNSAIENSKALQALVKIYSHREIPSSSEMIKSLVDMGFEENETIKALKNTCNNKAAAIEWLCGYRTESLIELRDGLSQDSQIFKDILAMPQVQMNLSNPKTLLAFLAILENEHALRLWGGDSDTTEVITCILQKYHEEKHVVGINQFYPTF